MRVSVCLSVCLCVRVFVCPRSYQRNYTSDLVQFFMHVTHGRGSVLIWRRSDTLGLRISRFANDVVFAYKLKLLDVTALGLTRRNTRCRQRTLETTSCSQGLLGRSSVLNIYDIMLAHNVPA